jgi:ribosomal subunit interface protein
MDIVVKGRNVEVPEHYRVHVVEKLDRLERYDRKIVGFDVELSHEPNRRQSKSCQRVEITTTVRGQIIRAEACAADFYAALDSASSKLETQLRRSHDRRRVHYGRHTPSSVATAAGVGEPVAATDGSSTARTALLERAAAADLGDPQVPTQRDPEASEAGEDDWAGPGRIVRRKEHPGEPMSVDQALYQMELVGHDFYLFSDADSGRPSVVYRRKGFDYGVIALA